MSSPKANGEASTAGDSGPSTSREQEWIDAKDTSRFAPSFACEHCGKTYARKHHLGRHVLNNCLSNPESKCNTDVASRPFVCLDCGRRFKEKKSLTYHGRHECHRFVVCELCHKKMSGPSVTERHLNLCKRKTDAERKEARAFSPELVRLPRLSKPGRSNRASRISSSE